MEEGKVPHARCWDCPLADRPLVESAPNDGGIMVVGEAPGYEEANEGIPFIGKSGKLLKKVLAHHEIDPKTVYYTNAVLCHPEDNETPKAKALKACRDRLLAEIDDHRPTHIIALGAVAAKSILGRREGISALRKGRPMEAHGAKIIPTFHTAAALREPDHFPSIVADIGKIKRVTVGWEPTKHKVATPGNAVALLKDQLTHSDLLAADIELDEPFDIHDPNLLCIGIAHQPTKAVVYPLEVLPHIRSVLDEGFKRKRWVWQNGKFDIKYLWSLGLKNARVDFDTMLASYAADERKGVHDLEQIATERLGAPFWKEDARTAIKEENTLAFLPPGKLWEYNAADADVTLRLVEPLRKEMRSDGVEEMYERLLIPASEAYAHMEYRGIRVDTDHLRRVEEQVLEELERNKEPLSEWVDNPNSHPQNLKALNDLGFDVPNTQEETIQSIDHPFVKQLLAYRQAFTIYSRYVRGLWKNLSGERIYANFLLHGTTTGRTSCRNPNLQNIPIDHPVRESFVPSEGNVFIESDYAQIELRVMATVCQDPAMKRIFEEGGHIHKEVARNVFGGNYTARQYVTAKSLSFGTAYGETEWHLAARLGISVRGAKELIDSFFRRFPAVKREINRTHEEIKANQYLTSLYGRKRRFWLITRENWKEIKKQGFNFLIQSPASDIKLEALIKIHREKPYLNPVLDVHDSLSFDVPQEGAEDAQREIVEIMESVNPLDVPIIAEAERSDRWKMKS